MKTLGTVLAAGLAAAVVGAAPADAAEPGGPPARPSIPYVASHHDVVRDMLWMAGVGKEDVVYDLGSGDGRMAICAVRDFGARRAVGIEMDPELIRASRQAAQAAGLADRVQFLQGDLFTSDFGEAGVVALYLGHDPNLRLRPKLFRTLRPGARIVSNRFNMGEWQPDKLLAVRTVRLGMYGTMWNPFNDNPRLPDYIGNETQIGADDKILMWVVPAPVAGIWRGKIETPDGVQDFQMTLHQRLSQVSGTCRLSGGARRSAGVGVDLWGDHLRFESNLDRSSYGRFQLLFDGHVSGNSMQGTLSVIKDGRIQEHAWQARRETSDFTGTWEWPCASGPRSVRLRVQARDGHPVATYLDQDRQVPVTDFYDFGGGLYFTLLVGREGDTLPITKDTGWLIGEAVLDERQLQGKIEFFPYPEPLTGAAEAGKPVAQDWAPRLVEP